MKELIVFFTVLIFLSCILFIAVMQQDSFVRGDKTLGLLFMWTPGISAIIALLFCRNSIKTIGWKLGNFKYLLMGYSVPAAYNLIIILIAYAYNLIEPLSDKLDLKNILLVSVIAPILNIVGVIGEEIGWRGFLLPRLYERYRFATTSFIIGAIWAVWHFPLIIFTDFYSGPYLWLGLANITVYTIGVTFAYNWLWLASGSVWTVALLHSTNNVYSMSINFYFRSIDPLAEFVVPDSGIGIPLVCILIGVFFWRIRNRLPN